METNMPSEPIPAQRGSLTGIDDSAIVSRTTAAQVVLVVFGTITFLFFARPVLLPVVLACILSMTLKPLIRWLGYCRIHPALSSALVIALLVASVGVGFFHLGRPAMTWMNEAPQHMTDLRQRVHHLAPRLARFSQAVAAVNNFGATEKEKRDAQATSPTVGIKESGGTRIILGWTRSFLVGTGETLVLLYLLLASGDLFQHKLVHVMRTLRDKKRAIEINHEIQQNISNYLFSVTLINAGLGVIVSVGLFFMGVPNAAMWGMLVAVLNFVPYFGPVCGVLLLGTVGLLTFDTLWQGLLPPVWYFILHLLEANLVTPVLLGRRFTINPVVIFVSLIFWMWLWGVPGALLSVPILVSIKVVCDHIPRLSPVSELLDQ